MKRFLSLTLLVGVLGMIFSPTAYAAEQSQGAGGLGKETIEITEEYIQQYGIRTIDENGNEVIEIPIKHIALDENECLEEDCEGGTCTCEGEMSRHFSTTSHIHEIINVKKYNYSNTIAVTKYAMAGGTVEKRENEIVTISPSINLGGGISKNQVEGTFGVEIGGSYSVGSEEAYSYTVPSGYRGRIAYRYYSYLYTFDNKTTYYWSGTPLITTEEIEACSAETAPYDGYFYLQLLEV